MRQFAAGARDGWRRKEFQGLPIPTAFLLGFSFALHLLVGGCFFRFGFAYAQSPVPPHSRSSGETSRYVACRSQDAHSLIECGIEPNQGHLDSEHSFQSHAMEASASDARDLGLVLFGRRLLIEDLLRSRITLVQILGGAQNARSQLIALGKRESAARIIEIPSNIEQAYSHRERANQLSPLGSQDEHAQETQEASFPVAMTLLEAYHSISQSARPGQDDDAQRRIAEMLQIYQGKQLTYLARLSAQLASIDYVVAFVRAAVLRGQFPGDGAQLSSVWQFISQNNLIRSSDAVRRSRLINSRLINQNPTQAALVTLCLRSIDERTRAVGLRLPLLMNPDTQLRNDCFSGILNSLLRITESRAAAYRNLILDRNRLLGIDVGEGKMLYQALLEAWAAHPHPDVRIALPSNAYYISGPGKPNGSAIEIHEDGIHLGEDSSYFQLLLDRSERASAFLARAIVPRSEASSLTPTRFQMNAKMLKAAAIALDANIHAVERLGASFELTDAELLRTSWLLREVIREPTVNQWISEWAPFFANLNRSGRSARFSQHARAVQRSLRSRTMRLAQDEANTRLILGGLSGALAIASFAGGQPEFGQPLAQAAVGGLRAYLHSSTLLALSSGSAATAAIQLWRTSESASALSDLALGSSRFADSREVAVARRNAQEDFAILMASALEAGFHMPILTAISAVGRAIVHTPARHVIELTERNNALITILRGKVVAQLERNQTLQTAIRRSTASAHALQSFWNRVRKLGPRIPVPQSLVSVQAARTALEGNRFGLSALRQLDRGRAALSGVLAHSSLNRVRFLVSKDFIESVKSDVFANIVMMTVVHTANHCRREEGCLSGFEGQSLLDYFRNINVTNLEAVLIDAAIFAQRNEGSTIPRTIYDPGLSEAQRRGVFLRSFGLLGAAGMLGGLMGAALTDVAINGVSDSSDRIFGARLVPEVPSTGVLDVDRGLFELGFLGVSTNIRMGLSSGYTNPRIRQYLENADRGNRNFDVILGVIPKAIALGNDAVAYAHYLPILEAVGLNNSEDRASAIPARWDQPVAIDSDSSALRGVLMNY